MGVSMPVLVVANPGPLRDSLVTLLKALPQVAAVEQAHTAAAALRMVEAKPPALVLVDSNLPGDEAWMVLNHLKNRRPAIRCVVLSDTVQHYRQAEASGASQALLSGISAPKLSVALEGLLA